MSSLDPKYMAELWQSQADHWRGCYWRLMGKKIHDGKIVPGHVATPKSAKRDNETWRGLARYWRRMAHDFGGPVAVIERLERDGVRDEITADIERDRALAAAKVELSKRHAEVVVLRGVIRELVNVIDTAQSADEVEFMRIAALGVLEKVGADV